MKNTLIFASAILAGFISVSALAADPAATAGAGMTPAAATGATGTASPCRNIAAACKAAGFMPHGPAGKGLMKDCMKPIMAGTTVAGVTVNPADVNACQAKRAARKY